MTAFAVAYLVVLGAVGLYVVRLGTRQRRLEKDLAALAARSDRNETPQQAPPQAA